MIWLYKIIKLLVISGLIVLFMYYLFWMALILL